jgi:hypothetical protein
MIGALFPEVYQSRDKAEWLRVKYALAEKMYKAMSYILVTTCHRLLYALLI